MKAKGTDILPRHLVLTSTYREKLGAGKVNDCPLSYTLVTQLGHNLGMMCPTLPGAHGAQALKPGCQVGSRCPLLQLRE